MMGAIVVCNLVSIAVPNISLLFDTAVASIVAKDVVISFCIISKAVGATVSMASCPAFISASGTAAGAAASPLIISASDYVQSGSDSSTLIVFWNPAASKSARSSLSASLKPIKSEANEVASNCCVSP